MLDQFAGQQFSVFKPALAELAVEKMSPITTKMRHLLAEPQELDKLLIKGSEKANGIAEKNIKQIYDIVGFWNI